MKNKFTVYFLVIAIAASLLHDTIKSGLENQGHTTDNHPLLPAEYYKEFAHITDKYNQIMEAIKTQLEKYIHAGPHDWFDELQLNYAKKLVKYVPGNFNKKILLRISVV